MKSVVCYQDGLECDLDTVTKTCRHLPLKLNETTHLREPTWNGRCSFRVEKEVPKGIASIKSSEFKSKSEPPELYPDLVTKCPRCGFLIVKGEATK